MRFASVGIFVMVGMLSLFVTGCCSFCKLSSDARPAVLAVYAPEEVITPDGRLDEEIWAKAIPVSPVLAENVYKKLSKTEKAKVSDMCFSKCELRVLWNEKYVYVGGKFQDDDIYAYGEEDQLHHYTIGDVVEIFLKPENDTYYWELYGTPTNKMSTYFIAGRGALTGPMLKSDPFEMKVFANVDGTINQWKDVDKGWTVEILIPVAELEKFGAKIGVQEPWRIFFGRYNYSRYLAATELTSFPRQEEGPNFHKLKDYADLKFLCPKATSCPKMKEGCKKAQCPMKKEGCKKAQCPMKKEGCQKTTCPGK